MIRTFQHLDYLPVNAKSEGMGNKQNFALIPITLTQYYVVLSSSREISRSSIQGDNRPLLIGSEKLLRRSNLYIKNILQLIIRPNNILFVSLAFRNRVGKLIEARRKILTFIDQEVIVKLLISTYLLQVRRACIVKWIQNPRRLTSRRKTKRIKSCSPTSIVINTRFSTPSPSMPHMD